MATAPPPPPGGPEDATVVEETVEPVPPGRRVIVDEAPPPRNIWPWLLAALFAALAIVFFVLWWMERNEADTNDVPSLIGLQQAEARSRAQAEGFLVKSVQRAAQSPPGTVLDQGPDPGAALEEGARVLIVVSAGQAQVKVPDVTGLKVDAAKTQLTAAGLTPQVQEVPSNKPKGTVVSQKPPAGESVPKGGDVFLTVSKGQELVAVPTLQGQTVENATSQLASVGLVARVVRVASPEKAGTVIAQDPAPGQKVKSGSAVRINVSTGAPSTVTVVTATTRTVATTAPAP
jgi:serine/threonine-protein kinase